MPSSNHRTPMPELVSIPNSVCAPWEFRAAGVAAGIKPSGNPDVALIVTDRPAAAAGVFTRNRVCAAPVLVSREALRSGRARAVAVNAGNANACTGEQGMRDARRMAALAAELLGVAQDEVLVASTGVIGRPLPMDRVEAGLRHAAASLSTEGAGAAARAIMTTDPRPKELAVELEVNGGRCRIGGIAKGSGMIAPNLATMLAFLTTDAAIAPELLDELLREVVDGTFNCLVVDGDTSTNDSVILLANGASGVTIEAGDTGHAAFLEALEYLAAYLTRELARDGEGASKLVEVRVRGARSVKDARQVAHTVARSPLVKTALFGNDPNWGRILCAAGYSGVEVAPERLALSICGHELVRGGAPVPFEEAAVSGAMRAPEIAIDLSLGQGEHTGRVWTCDFTYDYVRINAEYTT